MTETPKDGFDLLDYPCEFTFKAMCRLELANEEQVISDVRSAAGSILARSDIKNVTSKTSRTGKYLAVSLTANLISRDQLEGVYAALSRSPSTVMTL